MDIDRRQFSGLMLASLFQQLGWSDVGELPACPVGFHWARSDALEAFVACPEGWHQFEEIQTGSQTAYFTRENYASQEQFRTGFTVNVVRNMTEGSIGDWCHVIVNMCLEDIVPLETFQDENEAYYTYCVEKINPPRGYSSWDTRIRIVGVGNKQTKTLYLVQFEAPADSWDQDWEIGQQIYEMFEINQSV